MARPQQYRRGQQVSRTYTLQAPTGGLNAVDALANMPESDAIILDNWFPQPSYVEIRNGFTSWATGMGSWVDTILPYSNASGTKLFALSGVSLYDVSSIGVVGAPIITGLSNSRYEWVNFATSGGQFLYAANGADKPLLYDGSTWTQVDNATVPAITGVTTTKLRSPAVWKNRLWFVEDGSMRAWYLPTSSIGGLAQSFDFGPIFRLGGQLQAIITVSLTDGSTFDDYIAFYSTEGELALYRGTDPAQAGMFVIQGVYRFGKPVGRRCFFNLGSDCVIICSDGFVSLKQLIAVGRINQKEDISYKILNLVNIDVQQYKNNFGWQGILHPLGNKVVINVPEVTESISHQYVMNTITGAWCRFTGWNASCFATQGDNLFFGGNGVVVLADNGNADGDNDINALLKTAFSYLGSDRQKMWKLARPIIQSDGNLTATTHLDLDFDNSPLPFSPTTSTGTGSPWDTSPWDVTPWSPGYQLFRQWQTIFGVGFAGSLYYNVVTNAIKARFMSVDYLWEPGGVL